jgi:hypothetical protein
MRKAGKQEKANEGNQGQVLKIPALLILEWF